MRDLLAQLRHRNLIRVALAYLAMTWLVLQAGDLIFKLLGLPLGVMQVVLVLAVLGFVPTLVFCWIYELTPEGLKRASEIEPGQSITHLTRRKLDYIVIGVLLAIVATLLIDRFVVRSQPQQHVSPSSNTPADKARASTAIAAPPAASIAVLPFADLSQGRDQGYFSDGLAEELITLLAKNPQLHVAGRTSAFSFRDHAGDLRDIGRKLGVATVLEGSVRKSGDRLRVTTQLVNTANGFQLWSETYDRELTDVFAVQDEIGAAVVAALKLKLLPQQTASNAGHRSADPQAYTEYLRGLQGKPYSADTVERSIAAYRKAIALDPNFAAAYAHLAMAELLNSDLAENAVDVTRRQQAALAAADKAVALDPGLAEGYWARGNLRTSLSWDWAGALSDFERALALNPGDSATRQGYGTLLATLGRLPEALDATRQAAELDPMRAAAWQSLGYFQEAQGQFAAAQESQKRALQLKPQFPFAHYRLGAIALQQHDAVSARAHFERTALPPLQLLGRALVAQALSDPRESQQALDALIAEYAHTAAYQVAQAYAWRAERDQAFAWLDRAYAQRDGGLSEIKFDPLLKILRDDPRYASLLQRMKLPADAP